VKVGRSSNAFERVLVGRKALNENSCSWFNGTYWFVCSEST